MAKEWSTGDTIEAIDLNTLEQTVATNSDNINAIEAREEVVNSQLIDLDDAITNLNTTVTNLTSRVVNLENSVLSMSTIVNTIYPIGSIYISTANTNPATLFGVGTWEQYAPGRVLIGQQAGGNFATVGAVGGSLNHTLTETEMPPHRHSITVESKKMGNQSTRGNTIITSTAHTSIEDAIMSAETGGQAVENSYVTQAFSLLQPYIVVYIWRRTA